MLGSIAVLDACVLYPASLRDFLLRLATARLYSPRWTATIHAEWIRNVLADRPDITPSQLARTKMLMDLALPRAQVSGYEWRIDNLSLPDPDDRHVLAAAIESRADLIITFNVKDFPEARLAPFGVQGMTPDVFALQLYEAVPDDFLQAVQIHRASLTRPSLTASEYVAALAHSRLPETSAALSSHIGEI